MQLGASAVKGEEAVAAQKEAWENLVLEKRALQEELLALGSAAAKEKEAWAECAKMQVCQREGECARKREGKGEKGGGRERARLRARRARERWRLTTSSAQNGR